MLKPVFYFQEPLQEFGMKCGIGFLSGSFASCLNIPFDVAKSRIQGPQPTPGVITYKGTFQSVHLVYTQEGWDCLWKTKEMMLSFVWRGPCERGAASILADVYLYLSPSSVGLPTYYHEQKKRHPFFSKAEFRLAALDLFSRTGRLESRDWSDTA